MKTLKEYFKESAVYWGENGDWLVFLTTNRDACTLTRSNWEVALKQLGGESDTVVIERANHWAVGWVEYMIISPEAKEKIELAEAMLDKIDSYPVLDEDHFSNMEWEEYQEAWASYGRTDFIIELGGANGFNFPYRVMKVLENSDNIQEFYESLIPSGEYFHNDNSGVSLLISYAVKDCDRDTMAKFLKNERKLQTAKK